MYSAAFNVLITILESLLTLEHNITHIRSIDVGGHRHNNTSLCEKLTFSKCINKGRMIIERVSMKGSWKTPPPLLSSFHGDKYSRGDIIV